MSLVCALKDNPRHPNVRPDMSSPKYWRTLSKSVSCWRLLTSMAARMICKSSSMTWAMPIYQARISRMTVPPVSVNCLKRPAW